MSKLNKYDQRTGRDRERRRRQSKMWLYIGVAVLIVLLILWLTYADLLGDTDVAASIPVLS